MYDNIYIFKAWSDILIDYITPLPEYERNGQKYKYILVIIYRLIKIRYFIPIKSLSADELAKAFIYRIYILYGAPDNIVSDRGTQFVAEF